MLCRTPPSVAQWVNPNGLPGQRGERGSPHGSTAPLSDDGSLDSAVGRRISADMKGRPVIHPMPERSILLLKRLVSLIKVSHFPPVPKRHIR